MRSSGPVLAFWGRISLTAAKFFQRCFAAPFAVWSKTLTQNESDDDDASKGGDTQVFETHVRLNRDRELGAHPKVKF